MPYTAPWSPPSTTVPWPAPPAGTLASVHLLGDVQMSAGANATADISNYDSIGRDMRDRLIRLPPQALFQVGDAIHFSPAAGVSKWEHEWYDYYIPWLDEYGITPHPVMGNHETADSVILPHVWAARAGVPSQNYTVDLGAVRALVIGGDTYIPAWDPDQGGKAYAVLPLSQDNVTWLDDRLSEDTRPTVIVAHAPLAGMSTANPNPSADPYAVQSEVTATGVDYTAPGINAVIDAHPHAIGWLHGHTHDLYVGDRGPNVQAYSTGSRQIAHVDASSPRRWGNDTTFQPVTPYVSVLDDGKTVEVRWRHHDFVLWDAIPGQGRVLSVTAT